MNRVNDDLVCTGSNQEIVESFIRHKVDFIVIGGLAVSWYVSSRQADDMDLLVARTESNSQKVYSALSEIGILGIKSDSTTRKGVQAPLKQRHYAEVLTEPKNGLSYREIDIYAEIASLFGNPVKIASKDSLICMKEYLILNSEDNTEKHKQDVALLRDGAA